MERERRESDEFGFIDWAINQLPEFDESVWIGPGDDCALVQPKKRQSLLKVDSVLEGVHFQMSDPKALGYATPEQVGYKAMARTISDIAAMAGYPQHALISTALPRGATKSLREGLMRGLLKAAKPYKIQIVGGDTKSWNGPLALSVSLTGYMDGIDCVTRYGMFNKHLIFVTGELGGSILGKHLNFTPRIQQCGAFAVLGASSMIDISDGLSGDLWQLCKHGNVGAEINADAIPISAAAHEMAKRSGKSALHHALHDGEDFELLFSMKSNKARSLPEEMGGLRITCIGRAIKWEGEPESRKIGDGMVLVREGKREPLPVQGYEHEL